MNKLHLSAEAQNDLAEIKAYIAFDLDNPTAAAATVKRITNSIRRLRDQSFIGTPLSAVTGVHSDEYRFLVTGSYMTFYRVCGSDVYVDRVLYGRRDYLRLLFGETAPDAGDKTARGRGVFFSIK